MRHMLLERLSRRFKLRLLIPGVLGVVMALVIACSGDAAETIIQTVIVEKPVKGDTITVVETVVVTVKGEQVVATATPGPAPAVSPPQTAGKLVVAVPDVGPRIYEGFQLTWPYSQRNHNLGISETLLDFDGVDMSPLIAKSWSVDSTGITFKIRNDVPFHDSTWGNVTAEDVVFSYQRTGAEETKHTLGQVIQQVYDTFTVVDAETVKMTFLKPDIRWATPHQLNGNPVLIQSKKLFDAKGEDVAGLTANGTGPYRVIDHVTDDIIKLEAVENHWKRNASIKNIEIWEVPEEATRVAMMRTGEADIIDVGLPSLAEVTSVSGVTLVVGERLGQSGANVYLSGQLYSTTLDDGTATNRTPLIDLPWVGDPNDPVDLENARKVRLAMSMAIDRQTIIDVLLGETGCASYLFSTDSCSPFFQEKWAIPFDVDGAKALLAEAGYPNGFDFRFFIPTGVSTTRDEIGLALVPMWEAIGITVTVEKAAYSARRPTMLDRTINTGWIFGHVDAGLRETYVSMMDYFTTRRVWNPGYEYDEARDFEDSLASLVQVEEQDAVIADWLQWVSDTTPDIQIASFRVPWAVGPAVKSWPLTIHAGQWPSALHTIELK